MPDKKFFIVLDQGSSSSRALLIDNSGNYRAKLIRIYEQVTHEYTIDVKTAAETLDVSFNTANKLMGILCDFGILRPLNDRKRYRVYFYSMVDELLN